MSNNRFFLDAMAHIDESLIEDAVKDYKKPKKLITTLSLIACFVLIIGISLPIIFFGIVNTPNNTTDTSPSETTGGDGNLVDTPSDQNILSRNLTFKNEQTKSTAIVEHVSDASIKFTLERGDGAIGEKYSFMDAIYNSDEVIDNPSFEIIVNGETVETLPTKKGTYYVEIDFSSVSANGKEKIITYYFILNGYEKVLK